MFNFVVPNLKISQLKQTSNVELNKRFLFFTFLYIHMQLVIRIYNWKINIVYRKKKQNTYFYTYKRFLAVVFAVNKKCFVLQGNYEGIARHTGRNKENKIRKKQTF